ncbi:hypothetical protein BDY24DRAFT_43738 [Mrakia frigida]|uniref:uncharacterized protein n=1 Tax=Mrakia frigida TaxID=29902 RepID=UPI003FCC2227
MILPDNGGEGSQSERDGEGSSDSLQDAVGSEGGDPVSGRPSSTVSHYSQRSLADRILGRRLSQQLSLKSEEVQRSGRDYSLPSITSFFRLRYHALSPSFDVGPRGEEPTLCLQIELGSHQNERQRPIEVRLSLSPLPNPSPQTNQKLLISVPHVSFFKPDPDPT